MTDRLHGGWRLAAAAAMLAGSPASAGPARDPIAYNAFCHRHFEALDAWNRCQDLRPKDKGMAGVSDPGDTSVWGRCENAARRADGRLQPDRMAACLKRAM